MPRDNQPPSLMVSVRTRQVGTAPLRADLAKAQTITYESASFTYTIRFGRTDPFLVDAWCNSLVRDYLAAHYVRFGSCWINPSLIEIAFLGRDGQLATWVDLEKIIYRGRFTSDQLTCLIRKAGLTPNGLNKYVSLADSLIYDARQGLGWQYLHDYRVAKPYRATMENVVNASGWLTLKERRYANIDQIQMIDGDRVIYDHTMSHTLDDLLEEDRARVLEMPWFRVDADRVVQLSRVQGIGPGTGDDARKFIRLHNGISVRVTPPVADHLSSVLDKAQASS
jgi:hypothetical protein